MEKVGITISNIAIIPARGGSQRIPRKNIKEFLDKPIISYPLITAIESKLFSHVFVSTEDEEISRISRKFGSDDLPLREKFYDHRSSTKEVIRYEVERICKMLGGNNIENIVCIYPTTPLLDSDLISEGLTELMRKSLDFVVSIQEFSEPVDRRLEILSNQTLRMVHKRQIRKRSQENQEYYFDAGQFYWGTKEAWTSSKEIFSKKTGFIRLPHQQSLDINTLSDWERLESLYQMLRGFND